MQILLHPTSKPFPFGILPPPDLSSSFFFSSFFFSSHRTNTRDHRSPPSTSRRFRSLDPRSPQTPLFSQSSCGRETPIRRRAAQSPASSRHPRLALLSPDRCPICRLWTVDFREIDQINQHAKSLSVTHCIIGSGAGGGGSGGTTASAAAAAAQKQKNLLQRLDADVTNIVDNFSTLVNIARVNDQPVRNSQETFQMEMRAARMVQAADSLLKLVSELKQTAIFSSFASLNEHADRRIAEFEQQADKTDHLLQRIGEQAAASLKELETHYYSSLHRDYELER